MKLPAGMYLRRGSTYYARMWVPKRGHPRGGKDVWKALGPAEPGMIGKGPKFEEARREHLKLQLAGPPPDREPTVEEMAEAWLATYVPAHRCERARRGAEGPIRYHLLPFLGSLRARDVTADHLRRYRSHLDGKGLKEQHVVNVLKIARCMFNWGEESGWVERSPWPRYLMPHVPEKDPTYLSDDDQAKLTTLPEPYRLGCLVMLHSGIRYEELCRLQANDLNGDVLTIQGPTKSRRMRRVTLPQSIVAEIRGHVGKLVPFEAKDLEKFNRVVRDSGINGFTTRSLRHTYAAYHAQHGSPEALRQLLGHQNISTTQTYCRLGEDLVLAESRRVAGQKSIP